MHKVFIGMSKSGKTYKAKEEMLKSKKGVLFINLVDKEMTLGYEQVNKHTDLMMIKNLLKNGRKVQYNANVNTFDKEVMYLVDLAFEIGNMIFCIDEVHLLKKIAQDKVGNIWKVGRHNGIDGIGITQRPQEMPREMTTQSEQIYIFKLSMEDSYLKSYGIDLDKVPKEKYKYYLIER